jgi:hypothetical protein
MSLPGGFMVRGNPITLLPKTPFQMAFPNGSMHYCNYRKRSGTFAIAAKRVLP